jgi:hypothetical protein
MIAAMTTPGAALEALPKVELHRHIEGAMRPETLVDLARGNSVSLPTSDPTELYRYDSLDGFFESSGSCSRPSCAGRTGLGWHTRASSTALSTA